MLPELRILFVEDSSQDIALVLMHLKRQGFKEVKHEAVQSEAALLVALEKDWDVVISDYNLPTFDGPRAISVVKATKPDLPVIVVSGSIGEQRAVETMRAGATDYVMKDNLLRLVPAIERAMKDQIFQLESRETEAALKKSEETLRQAQKLEAIGQLAGGIAHDFNNIIATIFMQVETLLEELDDKQEGAATIRAGLERISDAGERAKKLTRQLLGFSRKQMLLPKVINLNTLVKNMSGMLELVVEENIEFRLTLSEGLKNIKADPVHIEQVLLNLVVNSRDAMPQGGLLEVSTRNIVLDARVAEPYGVPAGPYALLEVTDSGQGISAEAKKHIFEPFFTTKPLGKGTGLGLSTVYGIVKQNRGIILVEGEEGKGAKFQIYFPQVDEVADEAQEKPAPQKLSGTETILFVEDEALLQDIVCKTLRANGYKVLVANNGIEALAILRETKTPIDLIITDVVMPQMGGAELVQESKKLALHQEAKFLFQSGYTEDTLIVNGLRSGQIHFLPKPYNRKVLLEKVRSILDSTN